MKKGFTLIELLVVIAIISTLASIIIMNLTTGKERARDTVRMWDLKSIAKAAEMYFTENGGVFPNQNDLDLLGEYFSGGNVPTDPKTNGSYFYNSDNNASPKWFCLGATMEAMTDTGDVCNSGGAATYFVKGP